MNVSLVLYTMRPSYYLLSLGEHEPDLNAYELRDLRTVYEDLESLGTFPTLGTCDAEGVQRSHLEVQVDALCEYSRDEWGCSGRE